MVGANPPDVRMDWWSFLRELLDCTGAECDESAVLADWNTCHNATPTIT